MTTTGVEKTQPAQYVPTGVPESRLEQWILRLWRRPWWLAPAALALCVAAAGGYVLSNNPTDDRADLLGPCAFKALTGYDCPGCGGTRMVWYVLHGNIGEAIHHHLIAFVAIPFLLYAYIAWVAGRITAKSVRWLPTLKVPGWVLGAYAVAWLVFAVLRNIPGQPLHYFYV